MITNITIAIMIMIIKVNNAEIKIRRWGSGADVCVDKLGDAVQLCGDLCA